MFSKKQIPNILTYARLVAVPLMIAAFLLGENLLLLVIFCVAAITDFFDGFLARKWKLESKFGAMLDQISDKLLVCVALLCLLSADRADLIPVAIIIFREIFVSGLREFMGNERVEMPVSKLGKWKTASQLISIILLLLVPLVNFDLYFYGEILLCVAAAISALTAAQYWRAVQRRF